MKMLPLGAFLLTALTVAGPAQAAAAAPGSVVRDVPVHALEVPGGADPYRGEQWGLATLNVPAAWQRSTGAGVTVAVIDTGVDATHPDLAGQVLPGIDYVTGTTGTSTDPNGHGTHVAGIIAALTGNGIGVSAVAPDTRILPIRVLDADGSGSMSDVAAGIVYAADHGAQVINMSLGAAAQLDTVTQAIAYARGKGVVVVAAAGNDGQKGLVSYPASDAGVLAVAATGADDQVASYSTRGGYVDVAAPGSAILSTLPTGYGRESGTSMASPQAAAVAALLRSFRPDWTPDQIEQALEDSAVDLGATGKDTSYGWGRIDAAAALSLAVVPFVPPAPAPASPVASPLPAVPAVPPATPAPVLGTPVVSVDAGALDVAFGARVTTRYTVTAFSGRTVQICTSVAGAAFTCDARVTAPAGTVTVSTTATANRRVRLVVPATASSAAATSALTAYTVRPVVTAGRTAARTLRIGLRGAAGQRLRLERATHTGWSPVRTFAAATSRTVPGLIAGARYRVVVPATASLGAATSPAVTA